MSGKRQEVTNYRWNACQQIYKDLYALNDYFLLSALLGGNYAIAIYATWIKLTKVTYFMKTFLNDLINLFDGWKLDSKLVFYLKRLN